MICSFLLNVIKTEFDMKKHSRLVERVVRPYLIFIALILAVAMIVMYFSVVTKLNYEAENAGTKIAETMARQVDTYIEEIDVLAQQVKRQPRIINIFYNLNNTKNDNRIKCSPPPCQKPVTAHTSNRLNTVRSVPFRLPPSGI